MPDTPFPPSKISLVRARNGPPDGDGVIAFGDQGCEFHDTVERDADGYFGTRKGYVGDGGEVHFKGLD